MMGLYINVEKRGWKYWNMLNEGKIVEKKGDWKNDDEFENAEKNIETIEKCTRSF